MKVILHLIEASSIDKGCKRAGVSRVTVYQWLRQENFRQELKRQRDEMVKAALDSLKSNIGRATETLVKLLYSKSEPTRARAAEDIIQFVEKAIEHEELEKRIAALEERLTQQGKTTP
jgi:hypothetical protein